MHFNFVFIMKRPSWLTRKNWPAFSLRLARFFTAVYVFASLGIGFNLLARTADTVQGSGQVRLSLYSRTPNLLPELADARQGWADGSAGRPHRATREPNTVWQAQPQGFELAANPLTPLLRYAEPSVGKRLALLYLGALDDSFSLAELLYYGLGGWLLWRLLRGIDPAQPFTPETARYLRWLSLLVAGLFLWERLAGLLVRALVPAFRMPGTAEPLSHYVQLNTAGLPGIMALWAVVIITLVYSRGVELSREAELVI